MIKVIGWAIVLFELFGPKKSKFGDDILQGDWQSYTTRPGDSLSSIAKQFYGDVRLWPLIYNANNAVLGPNPNAIGVNLKLSIPPLSAFSASDIANAKQTFANTSYSRPSAPVGANQNDGTQRSPDDESPDELPDDGMIS